MIFDKFSASRSMRANAISVGPGENVHENKDVTNLMKADGKQVCSVKSVCRKGNNVVGDFSVSDEEKLPSGKLVKLYEKKEVKEGCKQVYDKVNFCTFCTIEIKSKISRHLLTVHKDNTRVRSISILPKRSKKRVIELERLANEGNFKHNAEVIKSGNVYIVVARRQGEGHNPMDYVPCEWCRKFIFKGTLWIHHKNCTRKLFQKQNEGAQDDSDSDSDSDCEKNDVISSNALRKGKSLLHSVVLNEGEKIVTQLLDRMVHDGVKEIVMRDDLIKRYAALRVEGLGHAEDRKLNDIHRVSQGARTLARIVIEARNTSPLINLHKLIAPQNFDLVVCCTKALMFEKDPPSLTLGRRIGHLLGHVILMKVGQALRNSDDEKVDAANGFQKLHASEWNLRVNSAANKKMNIKKRTEVATIPLTEDLLKLRNYVTSQMRQKSKSLVRNKCPKTWTAPAKLSMCRLILFNKRRRAEVKDLKIVDYMNRPNWNDDQNEEIKMALSKADALLASRYKNL